jgi:hypothetical protein
VNVNLKVNGTRYTIGWSYNNKHSLKNYNSYSMTYKEKEALVQNSSNLDK